MPEGCDLRALGVHRTCTDYTQFRKMECAQPVHAVCTARAPIILVL